LLLFSLLLFLPLLLICLLWLAMGVLAAVGGFSRYLRIGFFLFALIHPLGDDEQSRRPSPDRPFRWKLTPSQHFPGGLANMITR